MPEKKDNRRLLRLLADGQFHSGVELARSLGVSRAAVWKRIHGLEKALNLSVEAHKLAGYRLTRPLELLDEGQIRDALPAQVNEQIGPIYIHFSLNSTNTWLMAQSDADIASGSVCLAERQTQGRGRHGRTWVSPFGSNIYLSMLWRYSLSMQQLSGLSIACGVAVADALTAMGVTGHALKWPNDVLLQRKKLAGILMEAKGEMSGPCSMIVGVGINTGMTPQEAEQIDQEWASLDQVLGANSGQRNKLVALLIEHLSHSLATYAESSIKPYLKSWARYDHYRGERVCLRIGNKRICGDYQGIGEDGGICICVAGKIQVYNAGEVQLARQQA